MLFPWVALFHLVLCCISIWIYRTEPFPSVGWLQPLWIVASTVVWVFICDMKRWAAYSYVFLTSLSLLLRFLLKMDVTEISLYSSALFPMDVIFSFFVLYYFRRFN